MRRIGGSAGSPDVSMHTATRFASTIRSPTSRREVATILLLAERGTRRPKADKQGCRTNESEEEG
jgi:hypothetical protein